MGPRDSAPGRGTLVRASLLEELAYTCAVDLLGENDEALALAKDLLKDVRKSGLKSPFAEALLRRLALAEWTKRDRPKPTRLELREPKETSVLLFFYQSWDTSYADLAAALALAEDRARHLVHKARMEHVGTQMRIPIPRPECRRPRELLSDFHQQFLADVLAAEVKGHLTDCRDCTSIDRRLRDILEQAPRPRVNPPAEVIGSQTARPALSLSFDVRSRGQRRAGFVLLAVGLFLALVEFHPDVNAYASASMDRLGASLSRLRTRGERLVEDLRVLRALAVGTVEGRTEELGQTLEEYVNSGNEAESSNQKNKPAAGAVLDSRTPKTSPSPGSGTPGTPRPEKGSPGPKKP